ncbi:class III lanthionine synthetase LanKC [Crossiella cryophila]
MLDREGGADWSSTTDEFWHAVQPPHYPWPDQGWKLHVSATPLSAPLVLSRVIPVLCRLGCAFKFAASLSRVKELVSGYCARGGGGKFVTAYPVDDPMFRVLAEQLHTATYGLPGPTVLSDRRYRSGSPVYYRFGGFIRRTRYSVDGLCEAVLLAPDGDLVLDERLPWFAAPSWARSPLPADADGLLTRPRPGTVLIGDRFLVREAIQHVNKGGVYRAVDRTTGDEVVLKQARAHVQSGVDGLDARDALRNEADMLDLLAPLGITPRRIALFAQQLNLFLAQETVPGRSLRHWVESAGEPDRHQRRGAEIRTMARRLVELVALVHEQGVLLQDLTPNNIMVMPDRDLRLVDLEHATRPGQVSRRVLTLAYGAPETQAMAALAPAPSLAADLYSLGATLFFLVVGADPVLAPDRPPCRAHQDRIAELLAAVAVTTPGVAELVPLLTGLLADDPAHRWSLGQARDFLAGIRRPAPVPTPRKSPPRAPVAGDRLVRDGLAHIVATMDPGNARRLWPSGDFGAATDPCNVQHGAAGVLQVLLTASTEPDEQLNEAVRRVSDWMWLALPASESVLPGLHFGRAGTAWALYEAARALGEDDNAGRALELACRLPTQWPNPDVCHGVAGAGMALLHLWLATGDNELRTRMRACADHLCAEALRTPEGAFWPIAADFGSQLAGGTFYGFAHGVAGIGTFLLAAARELNEPDYLELAEQAGHALTSAVIAEDEEVCWPSRRGDRHPAPLPLSWCGGVAGIGTFLARLWQATGKPAYAELAEQAARTVLAGSWAQSPVACHGLAGTGEFLLDLAGILGDPVYRQGARTILDRIVARHALCAGRMVVADESMAAVTVDYGTGLAGVLAFAARLEQGGPRLWLPSRPVSRLSVVAGAGA